MDVLRQKVEVKIVDGNRILAKKGIWDTQRNVIEVKKGFRKGIEVYAVKDTKHIFEHWEKKGAKLNLKLWAFVDNNSRETVSFETRDGAKVSVEGKPTIGLESSEGGLYKMDLKKRLALSFLSLEAFFKYIGGKQKIPTLQLLLCMFAGYGIFRFIEYFLTLVFRGG